MEINELLGKVLTSVDASDEEVLFTCSDGSAYKMFHYQDCCESVYVEDINGDLSDLVEAPILQAEEVTSHENLPGVKPEWQDESYTWTFYKLATIKGSVTIRWYGTSNGYYSEGVDFEEI